MIYILDHSPAPSAQYLDDRALSRCIKDIAQVLCNVCYWNSHLNHYEEMPDKYLKENVPLPPNISKSLWVWSQWARECLANYSWLVKYGVACCEEYDFRNYGKRWESEEHIPSWYKLTKVITWCRDNVPDLPGGQMLCTADMPSSNTMDLITPFPVLMPDKFKYGKPLQCELRYDEIIAYRNYYTHKLQKGLQRRIECCGRSYELVRCNGCCLTNGWINKPITPQWTRREKPDWLDLNN